MDAMLFLNTLFGQAIGPEAKVAIWTLPDRATRWFDDARLAADYALSRAETHEVYFGLGLYRPDVESGRGLAADVRAITCVWADIDFGGMHAKPNVPPDEKAAYEVIARVGLPPSIVVHSGHGLHAYWLLSEEMTADQGAGALSWRWSQTVRACARALGYEVDAVGDLARVLRVPGTFNHKADPDVPVRIVSPPEHAAQRVYHFDQIEAYCVAEEFEPGRATVVNVDAITVRGGCEVFLTNSHVVATGTGIIVQDGVVHISNSQIEGGNASFQADDRAKMYVRGSTFTGVPRRAELAMVQDQGGNRYR
jgi:hypothetical protein